jgi:hypothetical protein
VSSFVSVLQLDDEVQRRRQRWPITSLLELLRGTARALATAPRGAATTLIERHLVGLGPDGRIGVADLRLSEPAAAFALGDLAWRLLMGRPFDPSRGASSEELDLLTRRAGDDVTNLLGELLDPEPSHRPSLRDAARRLDDLRSRRPGPGLSAVANLLQGNIAPVPTPRAAPRRAPTSGATEDWSMLPDAPPSPPGAPGTGTTDWSQLPIEGGRSGATTDWSMLPVDEQPDRSGGTTDWSMLPIED